MRHWTGSILKLINSYTHSMSGYLIGHNLIE